MNGKKSESNIVSEAFRNYLRYAGYVLSLQKNRREISERDYVGLKASLRFYFDVLTWDEKKEAKKILNPFTFDSSSVSVAVDREMVPAACLVV